jgi:hypothetical protein
MKNQEKDKKCQHPNQLLIRVSGPKVTDAKLSVSDFIDVARRTQLALKQIGQVLYGKRSHTRGRKKKEIEQYCELYLVGWEKGSAIARFELPPQSSQKELFGHIGEESLSALVRGMDKIKQESITPKELPEGFDAGVIQTVEGIGAILAHGIDEISFSIPDGEITNQVAYNEDLRTHIRQFIAPPEELGLSSKVGRLEVLNGHGELSGRLWEPDGTRWICAFKKEHLETLSNAWMRNVKISGQVSLKEGKEGSIEVASIAILDEEMGGFEEEQFSPFWKSVPTDELAERQGVSPVSSLDELSALWPVDDDPDELLRFILAERENRRKLNRDAEADK